MRFTELNLSKPLQGAIGGLGYEETTPIQTQAIPPGLQGRDIVGSAQTGSGKTLAFVLPALERLLQDQARTRNPRVVVLEPTRELVIQVAGEAQKLAARTSLRIVSVYGGAGMRKQTDRLRQRADVVIATPGRLMDHMRRKNVDLKDLQILVLDEADRMLDMGFIHDIRRVLNLLPARRQNMLFSATFSNEIKRLADGLLRNPARIEVAPPNTTVETVEQVVHPVARTRKRALLSHLIKEGDWRQVLVFTRTKHGANRLAKQLTSDGVSAVAIHSNKSQSARTRALAGFKRGAVRTLVATDLASRGLDIDQLPHVVNFELPHVPEDYIHRIGRTGRAGANGVALSLVCVEERKHLAEIQKLLRCEIQVKEIAGFKQEAAAAQASVTRQFQRRPESAGKSNGFKRWPSRQRRGKNAGRLP